MYEGAYLNYFMFNTKVIICITKDWYLWSPGRDAVPAGMSLGRLWNARNVSHDGMASPALLNRRFTAAEARDNQRKSWHLCLVKESWGMRWCGDNFR